jgi:hypothetical protein
MRTLNAWNGERFPWHVDVDLFQKKILLQGRTVWNQAANSCEIREDDWDEADALVGADGKVEGSCLLRKVGQSTLLPSREQLQNSQVSR